MAKLGLVRESPSLHPVSSHQVQVQEHLVCSDALFPFILAFGDKLMDVLANFRAGIGEANASYREKKIVFASSLQNHS